MRICSTGSGEIDVRMCSTEVVREMCAYALQGAVREVCAYDLQKW